MINVFDIFGFSEQDTTDAVSDEEEDATDAASEEGNILIASCIFNNIYISSFSMQFIVLRIK